MRPSFLLSMRCCSTVAVSGSFSHRVVSHEPDRWDLREWSDARFITWRSLSSTFESVSAFAFPSMLLRTGDHFEDVVVAQVSQDFVALFGGHNSPRSKIARRVR